MNLLNIAHQSFAKRLFDIILATVGLLLTAPLMVAVAAAIRSQMGVPIFFKQVRPGYKGKPFVMYKFRTMNEDRDSQSNLRPDSERLTSLGSFLRSTSLDELPELINVLKGDMSLVGPRPLLMKYLQFFTETENTRHNIKPGVTGWAQIHGRNLLTWDKRLKLDVWYVENSSLSLDIQILIKTIKISMSKKGVLVDPRSIMLDLDKERA
jgi:lipopolysaccharide/colanic/teichoic acid biosynthesis glycosyltransferase